MSVTIKLSSSLRGFVNNYNPLTGLEINVPPGLTAAALLTQIGVPPEKIKIVMINGIHGSLDRIVNDGDRLGFFPAVGGG
ncbi:MAG: MoaD/ThiS family protein [Pseudomonadota bacterium]